MEKNEEFTLAEERAEENLAEDNGTDSANNTQVSGDGTENGDLSDREEYDRLIKTKYKDFYTEDTQKMINRRFKHYKALEERLKTLESEAESSKKAEMSREQITEALYQHEDELRSRFPDFDIEASQGSDSFMSLAKVALESGNISLTQAYRLAYFDSIVGKEVEKAQREAEERMTESFRSRRSRPSENAISPRREKSAIDISSLTREERAHLALRASRGEKIKL